MTRYEPDRPPMFPREDGEWVKYKDAAAERDEALHDYHEQRVAFDRLFDEADAIRKERDEARRQVEQLIDQLAQLRTAVLADNPWHGLKPTHAPNDERDEAQRLTAERDEARQQVAALRSCIEDTDNVTARDGILNDTAAAAGAHDRRVRFAALEEAAKRIMEIHHAHPDCGEQLWLLESAAEDIRALAEKEGE